jgi:hypothetical protein
MQKKILWIALGLVLAGNLQVNVEWRIGVCRKFSVVQALG